MHFENSQIKKIVVTDHNYDLSFRYFDQDIVEEMRITKLAYHYGYYVNAHVSSYGYENECQLYVSEQNMVRKFACECPYCMEDQGCAHIGALMLKINELYPLHFPYSYVKGESDLDPDAYEQQRLAYEQEQKRLREERIRRYREERLQREEAEQKRLQIMRLADTNQLIFGEKSRLQRSLLVDQSGSVSLMLCYDHTATYQYDYGIYFSMKVGKKRYYIVKNIFQFVEDVKAKKKGRYGKTFEFVHQMEAFDEESQMILRFLFTYTNDYGYANTVADRRTPCIDGHHLRSFYELCDSLSSQYCDITTIEKTICLKIKIHEFAEYIQLELENMPALKIGYLDESGLYQVDNKQIIRYVFDEQGKVGRLLDRFIKNKGEVLIAKSDVSSFGKYIWQDIAEYCIVKGNVHLFDTDDLDELILYGDMDDSGVMSLRLEGKKDGQRFFGFHEPSQTQSLRLEIAETYIKNFAEVIDTGDHVAYLPANDDSVYAFVKDGLPFLQDYCDVYISDAIMKIGNEHHVNLQTGVRLSENMLEFHFHSQEIAPDELFDVLRSYRRKRKYHRLKNGQLLSLDASEIQNFDEMVELLRISPVQMKTGSVKVPTYRAFSLATLSEEQGNIAMDRSEEIQHLYETIMQRQGTQFVVPKHYQTILRDYQIQGYQWLKLMNHYQFGAILADDMGLGKTLQVIALLESEKNNGVSLVVAPASLIYNWQDEIAKFTTGLRSVCISGKGTKRAKLIKEIQNYDVAITSYDYLRRDIDQYEEFTFHYVVLDEAQYIKNQKTKNAHSVKSLSARHRLALTGTPIENSLAELWSIFDFLMSGYLYNYHYFAQMYEKPIVKEHNHQMEQKLKRLVEPFILRRCKKEVLKELPDKVEHVMMIPFYEEEEKLYMANLMQVSKEVQMQLQENHTDRIQILAMLTRLRQICCEPRLVYENIYTVSSKLNTCIELCLSLREHHQSVLLFSSFTSILDLIEDELRRYHFHTLKLTGKNTKEERRNMVKQFQAKQADVFLVSLKAGGTGLNLTAAEAVIHYDPWWNISAQNQATDRAYRIGQEKNVQVFQLIMKNSIEEKIQKLQMKKQNLADTFVENSHGSIATMDLKEILTLFSQ